MKTYKTKKHCAVLLKVAIQLHIDRDDKFQLAMGEVNRQRLENAENLIQEAIILLKQITNKKPSSCTTNTVQ